MEIIGGTPETTNLGDITREWTVRAGFLWLRKDTISVHAWQVANDDGGLIRSATAMVEISRNGEPVYPVKISHPLPWGNEFLALQVYAASQQPGWQYPEYREMLQRFAFMCEFFDPRSVIVIWSEDHPSYERTVPST